MKIEESLNVTFNQTPSPPKISPLVDDDLDEEEAIKIIEKYNLENDIKDETLEIDKIVNIKESRNHPLENVIGNLNQRTLRSQAQNQSYNQQEGINYDETYAPVARLESIRILLAYVCALDFKLFKMDVKCAFLNGFINEEVYVSQPSGFIDFEKPDHVYKLKKALYGLKQAPKAWYDRLKAFLIKHEYKIGMVDNTLFTKKKSSNLIIVQIYVDDIIFGSTCQDMCDEFAKIMHDEFKMSMMGELNFFLGLQIKQMEDGIFFNQSKYIKEMLKKFGLEDSKPMKTPMSSNTKLTKDEECESVDSTKYRGMIGSLLYLTASRPDIMFSVCLCARFQEAPKTSHLEAVKRIFRYIKGTTHLGLWYPKGTGIETVVYADSDHAGDYVDRKSTSGICTFVGCCLTSWFSKKQTALAISTTEAEYVSAEKACQQALWDETSSHRLTKDIKVKQKSKTNKNRHERKKDQVQERDMRKDIKAGSARQQEKKVNEDPIEVKGPILTSFKITRAYLEVSLSSPAVQQLWTLYPGKQTANLMTNTQTPPPATTVVIPTGAPATNTVANHAERPEKFNGQNFKRWQQKMFFYLTTLGLARFLKETAPQVEPPAEGQSSNAQAVQAVEAWKHSDFLCHNYVLNGLIDPLYNVYCKTTTAKELWESLER
ncbi:retrovirus-related pol polyprotein from transposon TNT 1-94, partial [Tanacetum coccineum]